MRCRRSYRRPHKSRFVEMFGNELELGRWPSTTVGEVANVCVGVVIKPTQYYQESGIRAFRSLNIGEMMVKDDDWVLSRKRDMLKTKNLWCTEMMF